MERCDAVDACLTCDWATGSYSCGSILLSAQNLLTGHSQGESIGGKVRDWGLTDSKFEFTHLFCLPGPVFLRSFTLSTKASILLT